MAKILGGLLGGQAVGLALPFRGVLDVAPLYFGQFSFGLLLFLLLLAVIAGGILEIAELRWRRRGAGQREGEEQQEGGEASHQNPVQRGRRQIVYTDFAVETSGKRFRPCSRLGKLEGRSRPLQEIAKGWANWCLPLLEKFRSLNTEGFGARFEVSGEQNCGECDCDH